MPTSPRSQLSFGERYSFIVIFFRFSLLSHDPRAVHCHRRHLLATSTRPSGLMISSKHSAILFLDSKSLTSSLLRPHRGLYNTLLLPDLVRSLTERPIEWMAMCSMTLTSNSTYIILDHILSSSASSKMATPSLLARTIGPSPPSPGATLRRAALVMEPGPPPWDPASSAGNGPEAPPAGTRPGVFHGHDAHPLLVAGA